MPVPTEVVKLATSATNILNLNDIIYFPGILKSRKYVATSLGYCRECPRVYGKTYIRTDGAPEIRAV